MNRIIYPLLGLAVFMLVSAFTLVRPPAKGPDYIGAKSCKGCHNTTKGGKTYAKWEKSAHANAFKTLKTKEADKIAKEAGHSTPAAETKECLSCHVTGMLDAGASFDKKFKKEEGVGCESCHGPGDKYKLKHNTPEKVAKAGKLGMIFPKVADGSAEKQCITCHNKKSPTYKPFKFKEMWAEIEHSLPE